MLFSGSGAQTARKQSFTKPGKQINFILWYSANGPLEGFNYRDGRKSTTKRENPAFAGGSRIQSTECWRSFASLSLREVAREAGIAPTSFYRHFRDVDELGLTMVDESGLMLRQLMRQARQRIAKGGSVIRTSVSTFMEFIGNNPNAFRLLLRERSGTSAAFRAAVAREIQHFIAELADYLELENHMPRAFTEAQAEAMVTIVFSAGAEALDVSIEQRKQLEERLVLQLRMISKGAYYWYRREQEKLAHQNDE